MLELKVPVKAKAKRKTPKVIKKPQSIVLPVPVLAESKFKVEIKKAINPLNILRSKIKFPVVTKELVVKFFSKQKQDLNHIFSKQNWRRATSVFLLLVIIFSTTLVDRTVNAATYSFIQTNWSGGVSADTAIHPGDQSGWNKFESKDANLAVVNAGAGLGLSAVAGSLTQSDNSATTTGFNLSGKTFSNTIVDGVADSASVTLSKTNIATPMIAGGPGNAFVVKSDGSAWAWGLNSNNNLGDGSATQRNFPVQISGLTSGVVAVAAGQSSYTLKADGSVWAWGYNATGGLGDNSTVAKTTPVQVSGLTSGVIAIAAGSTSGYALKADGSVWAWGDNTQGQLGDNSTTRRLVPVQVSGLISDVVAISAGGQSAYALKADGSVWAWGYNGSGCLGDNSTTRRLVPVQVSGLTSDVVAISAGSLSGYAVKSDGSVWSWGDNAQGQLGDNSLTPKLVPVQVSGLTSDVVSIATNSATLSAYILKTDGSVWSWGYNNVGQLGDNSTTRRLVPVQVSGLTS
ncbi:MAG: hypothetical protein WCJ57_04130, partial [Candidatus Falkowbacteria bacterium]